ncbi:MAG: hypothetical protein IKM00_00575, partial [Clostridia bacterium]|nr:hypothetical protein [Clostridia bacterium]
VKVVHADVVIRAANAAATNFFVAFFMFTQSFLFSSGERGEGLAHPPDTVVFSSVSEKSATVSRHGF